MHHFVITQFHSLFIAHDPAGRKANFVDRRSACFIVTKMGKIRFTYDGGSLVAQPNVPVFLPKGLSYLNECLEAAESYVFNFQTLEQDLPPMQLSAISDASVLAYYERIRAHHNFSDLSNQLLIFEALYSLAYQLLGAWSENSTMHPVVTQALHCISQNYDSADFTVKAVAAFCCVSEVYLRKLFMQALHLSPFQKIIEMRMNKAQILIEEKRPLKEIAETIGYADVYQFSRAYKRYFGYSPSKSS